MASLVIDSGSMTGSRRDVVRDVLLLGRDKGCDIVFMEDTVSRKHARIVRSGDGYYLEDLQSRNGTFVNGRRVNGPVRLRDGDNVHLYDVALRRLGKAELVLTRFQHHSRELDRRLEHEDCPFVRIDVLGQELRREHSHHRQHARGRE